MGVDVGDVVALVGHVAGFLQAFVASFIRAVATGDKSELTTIVLQLLAIYVALLLIQRSARMIWGIMKLVIQLAVLSTLLSIGVYIYQNGVDDLCDTIWSALPRGTRLAVQHMRYYAENMLARHLNT